jgi:UDP-N-acetylglucosamine:LPS N-acetylglucosamine transferase
LKQRSYHAFIADIRRYRPAVVITLSIIVVIPSFIALVHQDLTVIQVLSRFAESLVVVGVLVWCVTAVLVRYARTQARAERGPSWEDEMRV